MADHIECLKSLLRTARYEDSLSKGLHESLKALECEETPSLCVLASNCEEDNYKNLITALSKQKNVPLLMVDNRVDLGEWIGLCKYDNEKVARKIRGCSCVVLRNIPKDNADLSTVL